MTWGNEKYDWKLLVSHIQSEVDANKEKIPPEHINWIQHYLDHGEYSMAFEYLMLEIMERPDAVLSLGAKKSLEIATFFNLHDGDECMIDHQFWTKFEVFLNSLE